MMVIVLISIGILLIVAILVWGRMTGETERIRVFFRLYTKFKKRFPNATEREALEFTIEEFIVPGRSRQLRHSGISGGAYLRGAYEDREITIDELIYDAIILEYHKKYQAFTINLDAIKRRSESSEKDEKSILKEKIAAIHKEFMP